MMKQINNKRHLQQEKKRLKQATEAAAEKIQQNWIDLKAALHPSALAGDAISSIFKQATEQRHSDSTLKSTLLHGIGRLARIIIEKVEARLANWLNEKR